MIHSPRSFQTREQSKRANSQPCRVGNYNAESPKQDCKIFNSQRRRNTLHIWVWLIYGKGYNCTVVWGRECWGYRGGGEGEREQGEGESVRAGDGSGEQGNALCMFPLYFPSCPPQRFQFIFTRIKCILLTRVIQNIFGPPRNIFGPHNGIFNKYSKSLILTNRVIM